MVALSDQHQGGNSSHSPAPMAMTAPTPGDGDEIAAGDFIAYVRDWLDAAALAKAWRASVKASRQLSLF